MSLVVTGATGHLGRLVIESLLQRGVPAGEIVAAGRNLDKIKDLADRGVRTAQIDFSDPDSLTAAFAGARRVLLVSGSEPGKRVSQHTNAIAAAKAAGVELLVYTSILGADTTTMLLATEHQATEAVLRESGIPFALLRNGWYLENFTGQLPTYLQLGAIYGSAGSGRISAASRADYAEAAAAVLTGNDHVGAVYELGGDESFTLPELAALITAGTGTTVEYRDLPQIEFEQVLLSAGVPVPMPAILADVDRAVAAGELEITNGDLSRLIGHPTTPAAAAIADAVA